MSDTLQRIFDGMPNETLELELTRVDAELERLEERKLKILRSLGLISREGFSNEN